MTCLKIKIRLLILHHENYVSRQSIEDNRRMVNDIMSKYDGKCKRQKKGLK